MHAGGLAASAELLVGDIIVEVNEKDPGIEPFASLLPRDETVAIRLRIVRMMEAAAFLALPAPAATTSTVALPWPPPLDNSLVKRVVFYRFPLEGWLPEPNPNPNPNPNRDPNRNSNRNPNRNPSPN